MKKLIWLLVLGLLLSGCVTYSHYENKHKEFEFRFAKRLFFNTYHLQIINRSLKRAVEFHGNPIGSNNYYVVLNNGGRISLDSKVFYYIGAKGMYWVYPAQTGSIPFEIKKSVMQNAKEIVFKGVSYIPRKEGDLLHQDDMREITVVYDAITRKTSMTMSDKVIHRTHFQTIFSNETIEDVNTDYLERKIDYKQLRLRGSEED